MVIKVLFYKLKVGGILRVFYMGQWVVNSKVAVDLVCHLSPKFIFLCTDDNCSAWVSMFTWGELNCNTNSLILPDIF